jgi:hypothetical protein
MIGRTVARLHFAGVFSLRSTLGGFGRLGGFGIASNLTSRTAICRAGELCATMLLSEINRASV